MGNNVYIAYALWLLTGRFGGHGFYPGKFVSGFAMMALFFSLGGCELLFLALFCFKLFATYKQERARRLYDLRSTAMSR